MSNLIDVMWDGKSYRVDSEFAEIVLDMMQSLVLRVEDLLEENDCLSIELAEERGLNTVPPELKKYSVDVSGVDLI